MEIPQSIKSGLDFYDYCQIMTGGRGKEDCITIRLTHTRMKLEATYTVCRDEEDVLQSILEAVHGGKARIIDVKQGKGGKQASKINFN